MFLCDVLIVRAPAGEREKILRLDPIGSGKMRATHASWLEGIIRRNCHGADEVKFRWELTTHGGVPGSYGFDAIATVKMRNTQPDRRFLMTRVRRYDTKLLSASLTEMGWNTIERIDYGTDGKKTMSLLLLQKQ